MAHTLGIMALTNVSIERKIGDGRYGDVLDVCEHLGVTTFGSARVALVNLVRQSPLYRDTIKAIRARRGNGRAVTTKETVPHD